RIVQFSLLERPLPSPETLATLTARLSALVGETRCGSPVLLDSHAPDAFELARFDPETRIGRKSHTTDWTDKHRENGLRQNTDWADGRGEHGHTHDSDPERSECGPVMRRLRPPLAVRVAVEHGAPVHLASARRGLPAGRVGQRAGPWRTSGAWWDTARTSWD